MRVLLDSCVWGGAVDVLRAAGHEVDWVGWWAAGPGDEEILRHAAAAGQVLVTIDKDFGELAVVRGMTHTGIVRRRLPRSRAGLGMRGGAVPLRCRTGCGRARHCGTPPRPRSDSRAPALCLRVSMPRNQTNWRRGASS